MSEMKRANRSNDIVGRQGTGARHAAMCLGLVAALAAVAGCSGDRIASTEMLGGFSGTAPVGGASPSAPPISIAGRWLLTSPGRSQCGMAFGAAGPNAVEGTIAPEGGCPGKFFTSRKWTSDAAGLTIRDHKGQPLAQLAPSAGGFSGRATSGEVVSLMR